MSGPSKPRGYCRQWASIYGANEMQKSRAPAAGMAPSGAGCYGPVGRYAMMDVGRPLMCQKVSFQEIKHIFKWKVCRHFFYKMQ